MCKFFLTWKNNFMTINAWDNKNRNDDNLFREDLRAGAVCGL